MKRNTAGQSVAAVLLAVADGSAFAGSVSVDVCGDNGTLTAGSGGVVSKGGGLFVYLPTQAETNFSHVAFRFYGTGAISQAVNVYPTWPQSADHAAGIAAIQTKTDALPVSPAAVGDAMALAGDFTSEMKASLAAIDTAGVSTLLTRLPSVLTITSGKVDITQAFPPNFAALGITAGGKISGVELVDTVTTYAGNTPQSGDAYALAASGTYGLAALARRADLPANFSTLSLTNGQAVGTSNYSGGAVNVGQWGGVAVTGMPMPTFTYTAPLDAAGHRAAIGLAAPNLDAQLSGKATSSQIPASFTADLFSAPGVFATGALANAPTGGAAPTAAQIRAEMDSNSTRLASIVTTLGVAGAGLTNIGDARMAYLDAAVSGAVAAGNPWLAPIEVNEAGDTVLAGALQAKLYISPAMPPVVVIPAAPADIEDCRVFGYLYSPAGALLAGTKLLFELAPSSPLAGNKIVAERRVEAATDAQGRVGRNDGTQWNPWVDLKRNDKLAPAGSYWTVTCAAAGFSKTRLDLDAAQFDLKDLITTA